MRKIFHVFGFVALLSLAACAGQQARSSGNADATAPSTGGGTTAAPASCGGAGKGCG